MHTAIIYNRPQILTDDVSVSARQTCAAFQEAAIGKLVQGRWTAKLMYVRMLFDRQIYPVPIDV